MIAAALMFLTAIFSQPASAFGPTVDTDQIATSLQVSTQFMLQSVSVNKHFSVRDDLPNSYFVQQETPEAENFKLSPMEQEQHDRAQRDLLNLSWMLGYVYLSSGANTGSGPTVYDEAHAVEIGIAWEAAKMFDFTAAGAYQVMPAENYSQGIFNLDFEFIIPLRAQPKPPQLEGSTDDAEAYYVNKAIQADLPKIPPKDRFPNMKLGIEANFYRHTKSQTTSGRTEGDAIGGDQTLNEAGSGPALMINFTRGFYIKSDFLLYYYDSSPTGFLSNFTIGAFRKKADLGIAYLDGTQGFLLTFPQRSLDAAMGYHFLGGSELKAVASFSTYDATSTVGAGALTYTFSVGGILSWVLDRRWKLGGLLDETTGTSGYSAITGGFTLGYAL